MIDSVRLDEPRLQDQEFALFQQLMLRLAGIHLAPIKKPLVANRLVKRLRHHRLASYGDYFRLLAGQDDERQVALDLLTTNETRFFREPRHFDFLRQHILPQHAPGRPFRVWSAASSSGEEAYSLAMLLADTLGHSPWEVFGSDISSRVLEQARAAIYPMARAVDIPPRSLHRHCLKGVGSQGGQLCIAPALRRRVSFAQVNLNEALPAVGQFDLILLRNVMIYFQPDTKRRVLARLLEQLRPGGWFFIGHSENIHGLTDGLVAQAPAVYRKPLAGA